MKIHQDARIFASLIEPSRPVSYTLGQGRGAWLQVARGSVRIDGEVLAAGDGAAIEIGPSSTIEGVTDAEFLIFDLP